MLKKTIIFLILASILIITGCSTSNETQTNAQIGKKIKIVVSLFPQYDFARQIGGDKVEVSMLLPLGIESHSYDPTPSDIIKINNSNIFIYTGEYMESWTKRIIDGMDSESTLVLDVSENIILSKPQDNNEEAKHDEDEHLFDPHIWTDPNNAKIMLDNILVTLCKVDEKNADYYKANADKYIGELTALDKEIRDIVANGTRREIVFGGKNAFHYFLKQYKIEYQGAYDSCSTESEASTKVVARLIDEIKKENTNVIYYEELTTPKIAQSISSETGVKMLLLHSCHNVSKDDFNNGATYLSLMKQNIQNLKEGLK
jgi:zinc transport system substrate-binding protein